MDKPGIGITGGAQGISGQHLAAYRKLDRARIVAICDRNEELGRKVAAEYGAKFFTEPEEMLALPELDIVDICSPDFVHCEHAVKAAEAGKHVLCEKPLCMSLAEAEQIRAAVEKSGVVFMVAQVKRWFPSLRKMRDIVRSGAIGKPVFARYQSTGCFFPYPEGSFNRKKESMGQFLHNGPHYLDEVCALMSAAPVSAYGVTASHFTETHRLETPNFHLASLGLDGGQIVEIEYNQLLVTPPWPGSFTRILLAGDRGTMEFTDGDARGLLLRSGGAVRNFTEPFRLREEEKFCGEIAHFLDCVEHNTKPEIPLELSIKVLAACLGVIESGETGKAVEIAA
jgi:predicted dehydrogenase